MDTKPEIPDFKLAKVGGDRRRKGAGFAWFGNSAGSGAALAKGGVGLAGLLGKVAVLAVVGVMGLGAFSIGREMAPGHVKKAKKPKAFAGVQKYTDSTDNLPKDVKYDGKSGLGMVAGRMDGKSEAELAAERAEAERLAREQAEAEARAAAEAQQAEAQDVAGEPGADPAAAAAAAGAAGGAPGAAQAGMSRKYGELSKSFGGGSSGLAGGAGVSGNFTSKRFSGKDGKALAFSRKTAPTRTKSTPPGRFNARARGVVGKQLEKAVAFSRNAAKAGGESSSELASQAFDGNAGAGTAIGGAGAGGGQGQQNSGNGDGSNSSGGSPQYGSQGDPYGPCQTGQTNAQNPNCVDTPDGTGEDDPTNSIIDILKMLLITATVIGVIQLILSKFSAVPWCAALYAFLAQVMVFLGAAICILGLMLMGMGRKIEGVIFAAIGALMAIMAYSGNADAGKAAEEAAKEGTKEIAKELAKKAAAEMLRNGAVNALGGLGGGIYSNNIDPRTYNEQTGQWSP